MISKVQSKHFEAQIDSFGRISAFYLKDKKYQNEKGEFINLVSKENSPYPLEMRFSDPSINSEAFKILMLLTLAIFLSMKMEVKF